MPCCGDREKMGGMRPEQMWDYINLDDFKASSCVTGFSYVMLWMFLLISIAVYAVDTFTAVNLIAFSRWSSQIQPSIPFKVSRWIFAVCIIVSFVLLFYRWIRAIRVIRSGGVAESYLDPLAVRVQSIRVGKGKGWKRFLVFAELTKSKKGADYVALFSYFSFEAWLRILLADGPRQVVNAITLYSVMQLSLIPEGKNAAPPGTSPVVQFFINVKALAEKSDRQAAILLGMLFTLVVWVVSALSLALSVVLYLIFLWHHIPTQDGSLKGYCRRKINTRLERVVKRKVNKALAKGAVVLQDRQPTQPGIASKMHQPTLPDLDDDKMAHMSISSLSRQPTQSTLPPYSSRPGTAAPDEKAGSLRQPTLPDLDDERPMLSRMPTQSSAYSESAPLMGNAATMGYSPLDRKPGPPMPMPPMPFNDQGRPYSPVSRPLTAQNRSTPGPMPMDGPGRWTPGSGYPGPGYPSDQGPPNRSTPAPMDGPGRRTPGLGYPGTGFPDQGPTQNRSSPGPMSMDGPGRRTPGSGYAGSGYSDRDYPQPPPSSMGRLTPAGPPGPPPVQPPPRAFSPGGNPPSRSLTPVDTNMSGNSNRSFTPVNNGPPRPQGNGGYVAFKPSMMSSGGSEPRSQTPTSPSYANSARPATTTPSQGGYRPAPANFERPSTTSPSNEYGRPPPNRSFPPRNGNGPSRPPANYDPYYGSAM